MATSVLPWYRCGKHCRCRQGWMLRVCIKCWLIRDRIIYSKLGIGGMVYLSRPIRSSAFLAVIVSRWMRGAYVSSGMDSCCMKSPAKTRWLNLPRYKPATVYPNSTSSLHFQVDCLATLVLKLRALSKHACAAQHASHPG